MSVEEATKLNYTVGEKLLNNLLDVIENGLNERRFKPNEIAIIGRRLPDVTRRLESPSGIIKERVSGLVGRIQQENGVDLRPKASREQSVMGRDTVGAAVDGRGEGAPGEVGYKIGDRVFMENMEHEVIGINAGGSYDTAAVVIKNNENDSLKCQIWHFKPTRRRQPSQRQ